ncbi:MAG TPA: ATP-binding protein [Terracidiphilus sp.]|nr:ATP-binding protein [Terracidiphilus sp.]
MDFELQRLILIDSYSPGRVVVFPLGGGVVLTGRNGSGKTSLLQLLPVFFGENPNRIAGTETNRLNFAGYYLPRLTSYILFEYRRRDVTCLMVMHASEGGEEIRYRFVRAAYKPELFLQPDGRNIIPSLDLYAHVKRLGLICTEVISSVAEYRSIIQGKVGTGRDRQRARSLTADFSFVGNGHHLTHIEKIVSGMFLRKTNFEDLQRMVVSCIADGPGQIALSTERKKIESWPEHFDAYRGVMQEAPRMDEILTAEARLLASEAELGRIHARLCRLQNHLEEEGRRNRDQRESLEGRAKEAEAGYRRAEEILESERDAARREAEDRDGRLATLKDQEQDYARRELPAKAERVAAEARMVEERRPLEGRKEALLGQHEKISLHYDRLLMEQQQRYNEEQLQSLQARSGLQQAFVPRFGILEATKDKDLATLREAYRQGREELDQRLRVVLQDEGRWKEKVRSPQPAIECEAAHQASSEALAQAQQALESGQAEQRHRERLRNEARQSFEEQDKQLQQLLAQRRDLAKRLQALRLQQTPGPDSLLYFLRSEHPDWVFDIAKVMREDLLVREDLEPVVLSALTGLYGIGLNLEPLDAHLASDEQALQKEAAAVEERLRSADTAIAEAQLHLEKRGEQRKEAQQAFSQQETEVQNLASRRQFAQEAEKSARVQMEKSRREAEALAREELAKLDRENRILHGHLQALEQRLASDEGERARRYSEERRALETEQEHVLAAHDRLQAESKVAFERLRQEMQLEKEQALQSAGVDVATLTRLEKEIAELDRRIREARAYREEVAQWRLWLEQEWPRREMLARDATTARKEEAAKKEALAKLLAERSAAREQLQAELTRLEKDFKRRENAQNTVQQRLAQVATYGPDPEVLGQDFDTAWTLELLALQTNERRREVERELEGIRKNIGEIKRAFVSRRDTPPEQFYDAHRQALGPDATDRHWIAPFKSWFGSDHDQYRRTLKVEANQIAGAIVAFHADMERFHRKVQQFSRELQQSLDDNIAFESISRVTVEIVSVIRQLEYWQAIDGMAEAHRVWLGQEGNELPPPEFAGTLRQLLSHWEVREGIRAELPNLIRIQGEVVENGQTRIFRKAADLERVSSNGLSYLILCVIFIAFINRIRRHARVQIVWALDELKDLDIGNIEALLETLNRNDITLVSAFPDPDVDVLRLFPHRFSIEAGRRLVEVQVMETHDAMLVKERAHV